MNPIAKIAFASVALAILLPVDTHSATMDESITCSLVYGALFEAAKRAQHEDMMQYAKLRMQAVLPFMQENKSNPVAKRRLSEIATTLENEVRYDLVQKATTAIMDRNPEKLKASMGRVVVCDKAFGLSTLPIPLQSASASKPNKYLEGFEAGCLAKQRSATSPLPDMQIQRYCGCMTVSAARNGVDGNTTSAELGRVISITHGACAAGLK